MLNGVEVIPSASKRRSISNQCCRWPVDFIKFYVSSAPQLSPGEGQPSEEAEEENIEEESGTLKDSQKALEKGQGAQQLEGKAMIRFEFLGGREEWIMGTWH